MVRRSVACVLLGLTVLLAACHAPEWKHALDGLAVGNTFRIMVETFRNTDPTAQSQLRTVLREHIAEFRRFYPDVSVEVDMVPSDQLAGTLQYQSARGLGPDLLLIGDRDLIGLRNKHWIRPIQLNAAERSSLDPKLIDRMTHQGEVLGIPVYQFPAIACYNRQRLSRPPETLDALIRLGEAGHSIGLNSDLVNLLWVYSDLNGDLSLQPSRPVQQTQIIRFLQWIRLANLQPRISFEADPERLRQGFYSGDYDWIPCHSNVLPAIRRHLGPRLGLAALPSGPAGFARPLVEMRVWVFGAQSSHRQREMVRQLVDFTINPLQQHNTVLDLGYLMPVNPNVRLPLKTEPTLALLDRAVRRGRILSLAQRRQVETLNRLAQPLLNPVLSGSRTPEEMAPQLERLLRREQQL